MRGSDGVADNDRVALTFLGVLGLPALLTVAAAMWGRAAEWLVGHGILVAATEQPLLPIPGLAGAGLDTARVVIAAAVVVASGAIVVSAARRAWSRRREESGS